MSAIDQQAVAEYPGEKKRGVFGGAQVQRAYDEESDSEPPVKVDGEGHRVDAVFGELDEQGPNYRNVSFAVGMG